MYSARKIQSPTSSTTFRPPPKARPGGGRSSASTHAGNIAHDFGSLSLFAKPGAFVQAKLSVNQSGDPFEREADQMAERVMGLASWQPSGQPNLNHPAHSLQRKCAECGGVDEREGKLMRKASSGTGFEAPPKVASQLSARQNSGFAMPPNTRLQMEQAFNADFSTVRLHTGSQAAEMNQGIQARAFTHGSDIYFNQGQYNPAAPEGRRLLGHELTHVLQQSGGTKSIQRDDTPADIAAADEAKKKSDLVVKIKTYGIIAVEDADAKFTSVELDLVDKALAGLPVADKAAIKGAKIIRVQSLGATTAGQYSNSQGFSDTTPNDEQKIELSNRAFGTTSAAESIRLITHEVGHAVAAMPHRVAMSEVVKEGVKSNKLIEESNVAVGEFNAANDENNAAIEVSNDAVIAFNAAVQVYNAAIKGSDQGAITAAKTDMDAKKLDMDAKKAETAKLTKARTVKETVLKTKEAASDTQKTVLATKKTAAQAKIANITDFKTDAATKLTAMQTAYTAAAGTIGNTDAESADYRAALTATEDAIKKFYDENVTLDVEESIAESAKSAVDTAIGDRGTKREALNKVNPMNTVVPAMTALEAAQDSCFRAATIVAFNKSMNLSVRKFYDFVTSNGIPTTLTTYASNNWPHKTEEFYAEAYSFFVTKPTDLEAYSKPLFDWFKTGKYK